jgi:uncharacterized SAM-binding protein YcdF (DUF218 family)
MTETPDGRPRKWLHYTLRALRQACIGWSVLFLVVSFSPLVHWWATALAGPWRPPRGDVLIVLGGSMLDYGTIGGSSYWRGVYAARAWKEGGFREVVVSGGEQDGGNVAEAIREFLVNSGVPREAIRVEPASRSTRENAIHTTRLLEGTPGRKVLLTSDYHVFRAAASFRKAGLAVESCPYPDVRKRATRWHARWPAFVDLVEETAKIGYYYAQGWI